MKKTLLATTILASFVSAAASAATVYDQDGTSFEIGGRVEVRGVFNDDVKGTMKDASRSRINFGGVTQISENLTGFGFMEYEIKPDSEKSAVGIENRYLYVGFGTEIGDFSYGKQETANVQVSDMSDIASVHSGIQTGYLTASANNQSNTFLYSGTFADALTVKLDYIAEDMKDEDSIGISAFYAFDSGLDLAASYTNQDKANKATLGAAYTWNQLYVAATYAMGDMMKGSDYSTLELAVRYDLDKHIRFIGIVDLTNEKHGSQKEDMQAYALEAQYRFNKTIHSYASYQLANTFKDNDRSGELVVGARYDF